jgi:hypothetical protein
VYLDLPAGDPDLFDDEAHETLTLPEVELVEAVGYACGEVAYTPAELVGTGQLLVTGVQLVLLGLQTSPAGNGLVGSALEVGEGDQPGLVEVAEASPFGVDRFDLPGEAGELGVEDLVFGDGAAASESGFTGEDQLGSQQHRAHLVEHETVELVGADEPLCATPLWPSSLERVAVRAGVITARGLTVAQAPVLGREPDSTAPAGHEAA